MNKKEILIGVISDTHIPSRGPIIPESIIQDFLNKNIDYIFHLGDYTTLDAHKSLIKLFGKDKVISVSGNMDEQKITQILPKTREISIIGYKIFLTHGSGGPNGIIERLNREFNLINYDIIIFGHTHRPLNEKRDGKLYLNPGTPTDKRFTNVNSYSYLKLSQNKIDVDIIYL